MTGYRLLACAIVNRAYLDLRQAPRTVVAGDCRSLDVIKTEADRFLQSEWADYLAEMAGLPKSEKK